MPAQNQESGKRVLDTYERVSEVLFGLIMVLTFTGSISVAEAGKGEVRAMLIGALGCNLAWGLIDGILYLMGCLAERNRGLQTLRAVRKAANPQEAARRLADGLPGVVVSVMEPPMLEGVAERLRVLPEPPAFAQLKRQDWSGALGVFLLVFLSTFPVVIPFLCTSNMMLALRISNLVAILLLFVTGWAYGRAISRKPWIMGISMVVLGCLLVLITMALGG